MDCLLLPRSPTVAFAVNMGVLTQIVLTSAVNDPSHLHKWHLGLARCLAATGQAREAMVLL